MFIKNLKKKKKKRFVTDKKKIYGASDSIYRRKLVIKQKKVYIYIYIVRRKLGMVIGSSAT